MAPSPAAKPLGVGQKVPEFEATTSSGSVLTRQSLLGHPTVVYFYPKARSLGCTLEAREFARSHAEFGAAGAPVIGVSVDSRASQSRFREECALPFDLVADEDGRLSRAFGVLSRWGFASRATFVLAADGSVADVFVSWRPKSHVARALSALRRLGTPPA